MLSFFLIDDVDAKCAFQNVFESQNTFYPLSLHFEEIIALSPKRVAKASHKFWIVAHDTHVALTITEFLLHSGQLSFRAHVHRNLNSKS